MGTIHTTLHVRYKQDHLKDKFNTSKRITWDGNNYILDTINLDTSWVDLFDGDITRSYYLFYYNTGDNPIDITFDSTTPTPSITVNSGEYGLLRLAQDFSPTKMKAKAQDNNSILEYLFIEKNKRYGIGTAIIGSTFTIY